MLEPLYRYRRDSTLFQFTTKRLRDFIGLAVKMSGKKRYITLLCRPKLESTCLEADEMLQL